MPAKLPGKLRDIISVLEAGIRSDEITARNIALFADAAEATLHPTSVDPLHSVARHHRVKAIQARAQIQGLYEHYTWLHRQGDDVG